MRLRIAASLGVLAGLTGGAFAQAPSTFVDLGTLNFNASTSAPNVIGANTGDFAAGEIKWYRFTIAAGNDIPNQTSRFLDIYTTQDATSTETVSSTDSEIGLYDNLGNLLANDDDDGAGFFSQLTFGQSAEPRTYSDYQPAGTTAGLAFNGRDLTGAAATIPAGIYWLATGRFNVIFGTTNWTVTSNSTSTSNNRFTLRIGTGAPEPGTLALLGLVALPGALLLRRRR